MTDKSVACPRLNHSFGTLLEIDRIFVAQLCGSLLKTPIGHGLGHQPT